MSNWAIVIPAILFYVYVASVLLSYVLETIASATSKALFNTLAQFIRQMFINYPSAMLASLNDAAATGFHINGR